jgi:hypothetical protein
MRGFEAPCAPERKRMRALMLDPDLARTYFEYGIRTPGAGPLDI